MQEEDNAVNRRKLLRRAGTVAAGLGVAGAAAAVSSSPASAAGVDGDVGLGTESNSGAATTTITSSSATSTLTLANTGGGAGLVLTPAAWPATPAGGAIGLNPDGYLLYGFGDGLTGAVYDTSWAYMPVPLQSPQRVLDTRSSSLRGNVLNPSVLDSVGRLKDGATLHLTLDDHCFFGAGVFATVAAISPTASGYLKVFPIDTPEPATANVGYVTNQNTSNSVFTGASWTTLYGGISTGLSIKAKGTTHVILDIFGFVVGDLFDVAEQAPLAAQSLRAASGSAKSSREEARKNFKRAW